jgi:DNA polymerase IV
MRRKVASSTSLQSDPQRVQKGESVSTLFQEANVILHIDMDAYYASVEERDHPKLVGLPVIVGGSPEERGVVAAANYEVRRYGVHSAMPMATAVRRCPHAIILPVRMDHYSAISREIRSIFERYTPQVEPLSLDEAFLDVRGSVKLFGPVDEIGKQIKQDILSEVGLVASVGVAPNKFLAKLASDFNKPDGFVTVNEGSIREFLDPLPVSRLWGVGRRADEILAQLGVRTIQQLRMLPLPILSRQFGNASASHLHNLAHGHDDRAVIPDRDAKSISHETTFPVDINDAGVLRASLLSLTEQVAHRLRRLEVFGRTIQIKVRYSDFRTVTRAHSMPTASNTTNELWNAVSNHLLPRVDLTTEAVRLVGVGISALGRHREQQRLLFDDQSNRDAELDAATDVIRDRFGSAAIQRGTSLGNG